MYRPSNDDVTRDLRSANLLAVLVISSEGKRRVELPPDGSIIVGRSDDCNLQVVSEGVSRAHARLDIAPTGVTVHDLGSRNGTHVNGVRLTEPRRLNIGDEVSLGEVRLVGSPGTELEFAL